MVQNFGNDILLMYGIFKKFIEVIAVYSVVGGPILKFFFLQLTQLSLVNLWAHLPMEQ